MTNREVLARKSNEELAIFLQHIRFCGLCEACIYAKRHTDCGRYDIHCIDGIQQWLEQEAKDD